MYIRHSKHYSKITKIALLALIAGVLFNLNLNAVAGDITNRILRISDNRASATGVNYELGFTRPTAGVLGSIVLEICSNSPLPMEPCQAPNGFSFSSSTIINQSGITDFSVHGNSTDNVLILTRTASFEPSGAQGFLFNNVVNPSQNGSHYARINTYSSNDGSGASIDFGGLAFVINRSMDISTVVPPYLGFCIAQNIQGYDCSTGNNLYVDLGEFSRNYTSTGVSQMVIGTNAGSGFNVSMFGTTLTSGNNIISALNVPHTSDRGSEQFGLNLVGNSNPTVGNDPVGPGTAVPTSDYASQNLFKFVSGDTIINSSGVTDWRKFTVSFIVNIDQGQEPGIYTSSLRFICLANF